MSHRTLPVKADQAAEINSSTGISSRASWLSGAHRGSWGTREAGICPGDAASTRYNILPSAPSAGFLLKSEGRKGDLFRILQVLVPFESSHAHGCSLAEIQGKAF